MSVLPTHSGWPWATNQAGHGLTCLPALFLPQDGPNILTALRSQMVPHTGPRQVPRLESHPAGDWGQGQEQWPWRKSTRGTQVLTNQVTPD